MIKLICDDCEKNIMITIFQFKLSLSQAVLTLIENKEEKTQKFEHSGHNCQISYKLLLFFR